MSRKKQRDKFHHNDVTKGTEPNDTTVPFPVRGLSLPNLFSVITHLLLSQLITTLPSPSPFLFLYSTYDYPLSSSSCILFFHYPYLQYHTVSSIYISWNLSSTTSSLRYPATQYNSNTPSQERYQTDDSRLPADEEGGTITTSETGLPEVEKAVKGGSGSETSQRDELLEKQVDKNDEDKKRYKEPRSGTSTQKQIQKKEQHHYQQKQMISMGVLLWGRTFSRDDKNSTELKTVSILFRSLLAQLYSTIL